MTSNAAFQTIVIVTLLAHVSAGIGAWFTARGLVFLLALNTGVALAILSYSATRLRYILAGPDWRYLGFIAFEGLVFAAAVGAFRGGRTATIVSCVGFGLHAVINIAALLFALTFKLNKLW